MCKFCAVALDLAPSIVGFKARSTVEVESFTPDFRCGVEWGGLLYIGIVYREHPRWLQLVFQMMRGYMLFISNSVIHKKKKKKKKLATVIIQCKRLCFIYP